MSLSTEDLQKYLGQNADNVKQELEKQGMNIFI